MTLLSICTQIANDIPVAAPSAIIGNGDETAIRLLASAQNAGEALARKPQGGWISMIQEYDFTTAAIAPQAGSIANVGSVAVISGLSGINAVVPGSWYAFGNGIPNNSIVTAILPDSGGPANITGTGAGSGNVVQLVLGAGNIASVAGFNSGDSVTVSGVVGTIEANGIWLIDVIILGAVARINLRGSTFVHAWVSGGAIVGNNLPRLQLNQAATATGPGIYTLGQSDYDLPPDFERVIDSTMWDRSRYWQMRGPLSPQQWQLVKSSIIGQASIQRRFRFRKIGGAMRFSIDPVPTDNGSALVFEYVSNGWCQSAGGQAQNTWQADTDTGVLDEYLLMLGTRWRVLRRLGFSYSEELDEYEREVSKAMASDGGAAILSIVPGNGGFQLLNPYNNIPESGFGP